MEIVIKDVKDIQSFKKFDSTFTKIWGDDDRHLYVFKRTKYRDDYEVIKAVKKKNQDGSIVYRYPSSEEFGTYGYYIMGIPSWYSKQRIITRLKQFDESVDTSTLKI